MTSHPQIRFHDNHRPRLSAGDFEITVEQEISWNGGKKPSGKKPRAKRTFRVSGPQYQLDPQDVGSVFPPAASIGDHGDFLPHVTLTRSTLPWERFAAKGSRDPWLVLLLVSDDDPGITPFPPKPHTVPVGKGPAKKSVIRFPMSFLSKVMPKRAELPLLCHVRETERPVDPPENTPSGAPVMETEAEVAVVMGSRLPASGKKHAAFLVSVEGDYGASKYSPQTVSPKGTVELTVLKHWQFTCASPEHVFTKQVQNLNADPLVLQTPVMAKHSTQGATVLPYHTRSGGAAVSFYRGPFVPGHVTVPAGLPALKSLRTSDALLMYRAEEGVFDTSYAAAWELGRLLGLNSASYSAALSKWRGAARQHLIAGEQLAAATHLIPHATVRDPHAGLPDEITSFLNKLASFELVAPNYLLPDPGLLPVNAIRFFQVDAYWRTCLLEGAISLGRLHENDHRHEAGLRTLAASLENGPKSGFLLRSEIIKDWPHLLIEGFDENDAPCPPRHTHRLSDTTLLVLFDVGISAVELHLKPEALHMGLHREGTKLYKWLKYGDGELPDTGTDKPSARSDVAVEAEIPDPTYNVLNISKLATALAKKIAKNPSGFRFHGKTISEYSSAFLALQMVESIERMRFELH